MKEIIRDKKGNYRGKHLTVTCRLHAESAKAQGWEGETQSDKHKQLHNKTRD